MILFYNLNIVIAHVQCLLCFSGCMKDFLFRRCGFWQTPPFLQHWSFCLQTTPLSFCLPEGATLHMVQWMDEPLTKCLVRLAGQLEHTEPSFQAASIIQHVIGHGNCHAALTVISKIFIAGWSKPNLLPRDLTVRHQPTFNIPIASSIWSLQIY